MNIFRPYYILGGQPYIWSLCEKNLIYKKQTESDLSNILEKTRDKVIEWAVSLCGLVNEEEVPKNIPHNDENGKPLSLHVLLENISPTNEYYAHIREEKLSKMLLKEVNF